MKIPDILLEQHGKRWAEEDKKIDEKLAAIRRVNGGERPNILIVLIDDVGFGEMGDPVLNHVRGYTTPNINAFAREGLTFSRMYSEPTCTPTRTAILTGRLPVRSHMLEPKIVPPEGMDKNYRPAGWVLGVDAVAGEDAREWGAEAGKATGLRLLRRPERALQKAGGRALEERCWLIGLENGVGLAQGGDHVRPRSV